MLIVWNSQHTAPAAAARAAERAAQCARRLVDLRDRRPIGSDDVARAHASLVAAQSSANAAQGRLLLTRARSRRAGSAVGSNDSPTAGGARSAAALERLRQRVQAAGLHNVYLAAFGVGGTTSLFDFEAFAHGLAGLPEHDARVIEQVVWELEQF